MAKVQSLSPGLVRVFLFIFLDLFLWLDFLILFGFDDFFLLWLLFDAWLTLVLFVVDFLPNFFLHFVDCLVSFLKLHFSSEFLSLSQVQIP